MNPVAEMSIKNVLKCMSYKEAIELIHRRFDETVNTLAIHAMKKQIPQKPDYEGDGYDDNGKLIYDTAYCPNCNHKFEVYYDDTTKYCPDCGQALDWGDEA